MLNKEMNTKHEGKLLLVRNKDKDDGIFNGGYVLAIAEDTDENYSIFANEVEHNLHGAGFVHYAYVDKGVGLHVIFGAIK